MATETEVSQHLTNTKNTLNNVVKSEGTLPSGVDNLDTLEAQYSRGAGSIWNSNNTYKKGDIVSSDELELYVSNEVKDADNNVIDNIGKALDTEFWTKIISMNTSTKKGFIEPNMLVNFTINLDNSSAPTNVNKSARIANITRLDQFNVKVEFENIGTVDYAVFSQNYEVSINTLSRNIFSSIHSKTVNSFIVNFSGETSGNTSLVADFIFNLVIYK